MRDDLFAGILLQFYSINSPSREIKNLQPYLKVLQQNLRDVIYAII